MPSSSSKTSMDPKAASRIQSNADRTGNNQGFKSRAQCSAARNVNTGAAVPPTASGTQKLGGSGAPPQGAKTAGKSDERRMMNDG